MGARYTVEPFYERRPGSARLRKKWLLLSHYPGGLTMKLGPYHSARAAMMTGCLLAGPSGSCTIVEPKKETRHDPR